MRKKFTYNTSKQEEKAYEILCNEFKKENIERQYKTAEYPYHCDFFITPINIYLEFNGSWTHGKHAYDSTSKDDQIFLKKWKNKSIANSYKKHNYYERAIYVWTVLDVKK